MTALLQVLTAHTLIKNLIKPKRKTRNEKRTSAAVYANCCSTSSSTWGRMRNVQSANLLTHTQRQRDTQTGEERQWRIVILFGKQKTYTCLYHTEKSITLINYGSFLTCFSEQRSENNWNFTVCFINWLHLIRNKLLSKVCINYNLNFTDYCIVA